MDTLFGPLISLIDPLGFVQRHILAPRIHIPNNNNDRRNNEEEASNRTQEKINNYFRGKPFSLGERYTDFTKILFICFFYSSLIPNAPFIAFVSLILKYSADKYLILRMYERKPDVGYSIGHLSLFFFGIAYICYVFGNAYLYSGFPYDNLCLVNNETEQVVLTNVTTTKILITNANGGTFLQNRTTESFSEVYKYCNQNVWLKVFFPDPDIHPWMTEWMTSSQISTTRLFSRTMASLLSFGMMYAMYMFVTRVLVSWFMSMYQSPRKGRIQNPKFSKVIHYPGIQAYIPQVQSKHHTFNLLCSDISDLTSLGLVNKSSDDVNSNNSKELEDKERFMGLSEDIEINEEYNLAEYLVGWRDNVYTGRSYEFYSLVEDFNKIRGGKMILCCSNTDDGDDDYYKNAIFSIVKFWPKENMQKKQKEDGILNSLKQKAEKVLPSPLFGSN